MPPHDNAVTSRGSKSNSIFNSNSAKQLTVYGLNKNEPSDLSVKYVRIKYKYFRTLFVDKTLKKNESRSIIVGPGKQDSEVETPFHSESLTAKKRKEKSNLTQH